MTAARLILCIHTLWLLLSRVDLPSFAAFPATITSTLSWTARVRTMLPWFSEYWEKALFGVLLVAVVLILLDVGPDWLALLAGVLLFHFGALEEVLAGIPHSYFGGFTIPVIAFPLIYFGHRGGDPWVLPLIRFLVVASYFFAGTAKLIYTGPEWFSASTLRGWLLVRHSFADAPAATWLAEQSVLLWMIVVVIAVIEFGAPLVLIFPHLGLLFALSALISHIAIRLAMGIFFPGLLLAFILVDWDRLDRRVRGRHPIPDGNQPSDPMQYA